MRRKWTLPLLWLLAVVSMHGIRALPDAHGQPAGETADETATVQDTQADAESTEAAQGEAETDPEADAARGEALPDAIVSLFEDEDLTSIWYENDYLNWIIFLVAILAGVGMGRLIAYLLRWLSQRGEQPGAQFNAQLLGNLASPAYLAIVTAGVTIGVLQLTMSEALRLLIMQLLALLGMIALFWYLYNLVSLVDWAGRRLPPPGMAHLTDQLVPLTRKALRFFLLVVVIFFIAQNFFNANITSWLAGIGIAGLAISLAAQDSLKHIFGSITILFDQPFVVGDYVKLEGELGTIAAIGFRSTRMRTLDGHELVIPNGSLVNESVENIGRRPSIRRVIDVTIPYDTPPDRIRRAVEIIKEIFELNGIREAIHHPDELTPRAYFNDLNATSLNIIVYYWHRPPNWWQFLEHAERFNQELFQRFQDAEIEFAFPTQTVYIAGDKGRELPVSLNRGEEPGALLASTSKPPAE